ncbi:hypothetical protein IW261DRAFT_568799 [Armillaria novae-zelandiae]|uniref:PH domain-containing protein n=1 Tax=Armillaria novae-zelandiae TaxID=153914 RepID=A0AA39NYU6_9AGAR|nr:hypothetical protein IW261DRAFT_568799 [Armillaria novae-zelandiae]
MRQSTSMDVGVAKPYMSQPMLAMPNPYSIQQRRGIDESSLSSPSSSPTGSEPCSAPVPPKRTRHSISTAVVTGTNTGVVFTGKSITFDGLPSETATNATLKQRSGLPTDNNGNAGSVTTLMEPPHILLSKQVAALSRPLLHETPSNSLPSSPPAQQHTPSRLLETANDYEPNHSSPPTSDNIKSSAILIEVRNLSAEVHNGSTQSLTGEKAPSFASTSTKSFHTPPSHAHSLPGEPVPFLPATTASKQKAPSPPPSRGRNLPSLTSNSMHDAGAPSPSDDTHIAREAGALKSSMPGPSLPSVPSSSSTTRSVFTGSRTLDAAESAPYVFPPMKPHGAAINTEKSLPKTPLELSSKPPPSAYGTTPTRRSPPSLPMPLHRFSMTLAEGTGSARLSPSLITRHPPMPILNLPMLPPSTPSTSSATLSSSANRPHQKLRSMPALPRQGTNVEEDDDEDDEDDDDGDDTEDGEESAEVSDGVDDDDDDRTAEDSPSTRDRSALASPSRQHESVQVLAPSLHLPIDLARLDLSFLDDPPRSPDMKGKGKQREDSDLASATPTASRAKGLPTPRQQPFSNDYFSIATPSSPAAKTPSTAAFTPRLEDGMQTPGSPLARGHTADGRPTIYKHASRSMINIVGPSLCRRDEEKETSRVNEVEVVPRTTGLAGLAARLPPSPGNALETPSPVPHPPLQKPSVGDTPGTLHRRRSLPTFSAGSPPPPYPSFTPHKGLHLSSHQPPPDIDAPHVVEGRETLPGYSNSIYLRSVMPRKMEFTQPNVQAKDRKWRRVVCELEGTVFRVYECPRETAGVSAIGSWWERKVGVGDVSLPATSGPASTKKASDVVLGDRTEPVSKLGEVVTDPTRIGGQTDLQLSSPSPVPGPQGPQQTFMHSNQSRSKIVNLLKPSRPHSRSRSDVPNPPRLITPSQPRSSLSTPRPRTPTVAISSPSDSSLTVSTPSSLSSSGSSPRHRSSNSRSHFRTGRTPAPSIMSVPEFPEGELLKAYTLQNAESGLGNDYLKRKNVIRVRMEGEQFLLQAMDVASVVEWIEGLHSATNVALDLDERPMPRGPLFPRRRRRRVVRRTDTATASGTPNVPPDDAQPSAQTT